MLVTKKLTDHAMDIAKQLNAKHVALSFYPKKLYQEENKDVFCVYFLNERMEEIGRWMPDIHDFERFTECKTHSKWTDYFANHERIKFIK